jgi:uncharacterized membrane protein YesL
LFYWLSVLVGFILYGLIPALIVWVSRNPKKILDSEAFK